MMKYITLLLMCLLISTTAFAGSCQDVQEAAGNAMRQRSGKVSEVQDVLVPDPETGREGLSSCLSTINALGDAFSLGVTLPDMEQIMGGICSQVDSFIQQKINEVHNQILNEVNNLGGNNIFKVYGTGGEYVAKLKGKLK